LRLQSDLHFQFNLLQYSASGTEPNPNDISRRRSNGVWRNEAQFSRLLFLTSSLVFYPEIVVGCCVLFLFRSGGVCQSSVLIQIFSICKFSLTPFCLFSPLSSVAAPWCFCLIDGGLQDVSLRCRSCCLWYPPNAFSQEVDVDFHRNAHGKS
jgi:hypothetical protein